MLALEILALLNEKGCLNEESIFDALSSFGLLKRNHSYIHPGLRLPRYRVSTVSLNEVRNTLRVFLQLELVTQTYEDRGPMYGLTRLGKLLLTKLKSST